MTPQEVEAADRAFGAGNWYLCDDDHGGTGPAVHSNAYHRFDLPSTEPETRCARCGEIILPAAPRADLRWHPGCRAAEQRAMAPGSPPGQNGRSWASETPLGPIQRPRRSRDAT